MKKRGYTIAELVFALMILTVFLLLNITVYTNSLKNVKNAERLSQAINIAISKTEELQATEYTLINDEAEYFPYVDNENYTVTVDVTEDGDMLSVNGNEYNVFKNIEITVKYIVAGEENTIVLKSLKINNNLIDAIYGENTI
ncbi:MAG: type II secretion system protein [Clostridiales bacterium]|nr:type II secretion system protein [Clostridiales bacterium]